MTLHLTPADHTQGTIRPRGRSRHDKRHNRGGNSLTPSSQTYRGESITALARGEVVMRGMSVQSRVMRRVPNPLSYHRLSDTSSGAFQPTLRHAVS